MNKLTKAKARMLVKQPFFATLIMSTPLKVDNTIPTAATDMHNIYYNEEFIDNLDMPTVEFVLAHEVMHMILEHGLRLRGRNPRKFNRACDYAINLILKNSGFTPWMHCLLNTEYKGMSAEQIYELLYDTGEDDPMGQDLREPENMDQEGKPRAQREIQQKIAQAANVARMAGKLPGDIARLVDEILNPTVPWQDMLREYMTRITKDDESWSRRNRRFGSVYLPARYSERMGELVIIGDTSGSISAKELNAVAAEVQAIAETVRPETIRVVWADAKVCGEQTFEMGETITFEPKGGGGTDMRVPLEYVEQYQPEIVILATDGYTPWPRVEPPYPLIVCCSTKAEVPIGNVVRL
jgi:predicted metal-dependent peptidase